MLDFGLGVDRLSLDWKGFWIGVDELCNLLAELKVFDKMSRKHCLAKVLFFNSCLLHIFCLKYNFFILISNLVFNNNPSLNFHV